MTEHKQPEEIKQSVVVETGSNGGLILPASIIVGSLIVAASVLWGGKQINQQLEGLSYNSGSVVAGNGQQAGAGAAAAKSVKLELRKDAPVIGQGKGKVTLVEFSDFQCPFCQRFVNDSLFSIKTKYVDTGKVKLVFLHFPLPFHNNAQISGQAAECANLQGKFQVYHDKLFKDGKSDGSGLAAADLKKYAQELGLNTNKFNQCLDKNETANVVKADMALGSSFGVSGTPSFLLVKGDDFTFDVAKITAAQQRNESVVTMDNGNVFIVGAQPFSNFEQILDAALK